MILIRVAAPVRRLGLVVSAAMFFLTHHIFAVVLEVEFHIVVLKAYFHAVLHLIYFCTQFADFVSMPPILAKFQLDAFLYHVSVFHYFSIDCSNAQISLVAQFPILCVTYLLMLVDQFSVLLNVSHKQSLNLH